MIEFFKKLLSTDFMPHGYCIGRPEVIWLHEISDIIIALAYFVIPIALLYIVKVRRDLVYPGLFLLFGIFILSCGATHVLAVYVLWHPVYRLDGVVKAATALASFPTALLLVRLVPKVKLIPSALQLREQNASLESEIAVRKSAEDEVRRLNEELERRVADRTQLLQERNQELIRANADLERTIAERRQAQEALEANRRLVDGITGVAPVLLYVYDLEHQQNLWINDAVHSILGYNPSEIQAMGDQLLPLLMHEEDKARYADHSGRLRNLSVGDTAEFEYRMRHKDGTWRWLISRERGLDSGENGGVTKIVGAAQDITDRKHFETALKESEERFRELADNISQFAWMADKNGSIYWFNQRWYDYSGQTADQISGTSGGQIVHPDHASRVAANYRASFAAGLPWEDTFPLRGKDGQYRWFLSRARPIRDASGEVVRWFGTNTDITQQRQVETELRHANSDLEQFAYSASHDLKEPLRNVSIYSQILKSRYADRLDSDGIEYLGFINEGAARMDALIRELLAYTEIRSTGDQPLESVDAQEVFASVLQTFADQIRDRQADVRAAALPTVRMRHSHLLLLLQNLIGNALKYCEGRPPSILITVEANRGMWRFAVQDNGIGIKAEYHQTIFGIFKRLHSREAYPGTGMGLAICQRIVHRYGGKIWVESEVGKGSTFYFTIPF
ncbi:MAG: domain S-box-containing protein [Bryobacterales bacterium]|jgi:PAS domain S-box-containing protein|nr:domain S-box-containing protein [Bryobacterales bacterium]